jgi:hypothetical protein
VRVRAWPCLLGRGASSVIAICAIAVGVEGDIKSFDMSLPDF